jgi:hypothetical protein
VTGVSRPGWQDPARTGALALVVFALAHNIIFLATFGPSSREALTRTGHGVQWTAAIVLVGILALGLALAGAIRLAQLSRMAGDLDGGAIRLERAAVRDLAGHLASTWPRILCLALAVFVCAENLEHIAVGLPAPGLSVLGSGEYHAPLAIFAAVAFAAAMVDALYRWRRDILVARIEAARAEWARIQRSSPRPETPWVDRRQAAIAGHRIASRAPPLSADQGRVRLSAA